MKFFTFVQNNSGGIFTGPAHYVIIEASNAADANKRAVAADLYFNGASEDEDGSTRDCPCCGDRWYRQYSDDEGDPAPMIYGKPASDHKDVLVLNADGTKENF